jgi:hypothetical protein
MDRKVEDVKHLWEAFTVKIHSGRQKQDEASHLGMPVQFCTKTG